MQEFELQLLNRAYQNYIDTGDPSWTIQFSESNFTDPNFKRKALNALNILVEYGYAEFTARAIGFCGYRLTRSGIEFAENGFREPNHTPVIQGSNSIYVNGDGNKISGNYNQISLDISQSELPDDYKQLMEAFVYEMNNPHLTKETRLKKITDFLTEISSGTLSGIASSALTTLLSSLFQQI